MPTTSKTSVLYLLILLVVVVTPLAYFQHKTQSLALKSIYQEGLIIDKAYAEGKAETQISSVSPSPEPYTSEQDQIIAYIKEVFGKDAGQAIEIARCESGIRAEAINHNTEQRQTTDYGLFQINDHWQGINNTSFLFD